MSEQRLIGANAFYKQLEEIRAEYIEENTMTSIFAAEIIETVQDSYLKDAPTIDPVKHGKWLNTSGYDDWHCSECGFEINFDGHYPAEYDDYKYCGSCGAKMDGDKNV